MNSQLAFKNSIDLADMICMSYLQDLSDSQLMMRPHPGCNHINWQVGHLIASENQMVEQALPGSMPALPPGFAEKYSRDNTASDSQADFETKEVLMETYKVQRAGLLETLAKMTDADFDKETGISYAPTLGALFSMQGGHWLMHCGQWVVVRRQLGLPALF